MTDYVDFYCTRCRCQLTAEEITHFDDPTLAICADCLANEDFDMFEEEHHGQETKGI